MAIKRKVKDAKDSSTNNLVYFNSHALATYMSNGDTVEAAINSINDELINHTENYNQLNINKQEILVSGTNIRTINGESLLGEGDLIIEGGSTENLVKLTYSELKSLRDNSQLIPGMFYRIIDYVTTTSEENTKSAGKQFDLIVVADDEKTINPQAKAALHEGDTYFESSNISTWKIYYNLDNDTEKYSWADEENGKGVIYRMIDDKNNDCPYDFKNILFHVEKNAPEHFNFPNKYFYTFSYLLEEDIEDNIFDATVRYVNFCNNNKIEINEYSRHNPHNKKRSLNKNVICSSDAGLHCSYNIFSKNCYDNVFYGNIYDNTFGIHCSNNVIWGSFHENRMSSSFSYNTFNNSSASGNTFGYSCSGNTFGTLFINNTFGDYCQNNIFGDECSLNVLRFGCSDNKFGNDCSNNILGNNCCGNIFGNNCSKNQFGNYTKIVDDVEVNSANTLGNSCNNNIFGNDCYSNSLGDSCYNNTFGCKCSNNVLRDYCIENSFKHNCSNNKLLADCCDNTFGESSSDNELGVDCCYNIFNKNCYENIFGESLYYNSMGESCSGNTFGDSCKNIILGNNCESNTFGNYYRNISLDNSCQNIDLKSAEETTYNNYLQNIKILMGVSGTNSATLDLTLESNKDFETKVAKNSNGEIKTYCEADLIA